MNIWFDVTRARCGVVFEMKLALYTEACASLSCASNNKNDNISNTPAMVEALAENILLTKPLRAPNKTRCFIDEIEQELHAVYDEMEDGYHLKTDDMMAFERAEDVSKITVSPLDTTAISGGSISTTVVETELHNNPQLYGELTSKGVRQLHHLVLQFLNQHGVSVPINTDRVWMKQRKNHQEEEIVTRKPPQKSNHTIVALDIGSGTGKLLFEWSLLARRDTPHWNWIHVGIEIAPSRMRIARAALQCTSALVQDCREGRWVVSTSQTGEVKMVLGEADIFTPGLLTNGTFLPLAGRRTGHAMSDHNGNHDKNEDDISQHFVVFCSGLGFAGPAVCELCGALERMWLTSDASDSSSCCCWSSFTCVFLIRAFTGVRSFPLFRLCSEDGAECESNAGGVLTRTRLNTTWMSEAPAWVLSFSTGT